MFKVFEKYPNCNYICGGDLNLSCIDWVNNIVIHPESGTKDSNHCMIFMDVVNELGMNQHCNEVTRLESGKVLDLLLSNTPHAVSDVQSLPGMSDHNIVKASFDYKIPRQKMNQRKIYKYNKANWDNVREATLKLLSAYFDRNPDQFTVDENNGFLERELQAIVDKYVPTKLSKSRNSYPWIDNSIKSLMRKRDKLYIQANKTRSPKDWNRFKTTRQNVKNAVRENTQHISKT